MKLKLWGNLFRAMNKREVMAAGIKALLVVLLVLVCCRITESRTEQRMKEMHAAQREAELQEAELRVIEEAEPVREEAELIAKLIYGTAPEYSLEAQRGVVWCVLNRVESSLYPDTVQGVVEQEGQWMGYSESNPVLQDVFDMVYGELEQWHSGGYRPMSSAYVYMSWDGRQIILRDEFKETNNTKYWSCG